MGGPLICFYGDDFTGSTDALESLACGGLRTVLFMKPPTTAELSEYPDLQAIGVAGVTRSLGTADLEKTLRPAFKSLKEISPKHVYYKVCSTFDSSPVVGSIGKAIDVGREIFEAPFVPLLVAAPALGRHCAFGNLFARLGADGQVFRLDRHPSMSRHPLTPADESDLRVHLARQTNSRIALFDILKIGLPPARAQVELETLLLEKPDVVLFDAIYQEQLAGIGELLDGFATPGPLFSVGSSGLAAALVTHWAGKGSHQSLKCWPEPGPARPLLVLSGSCSPVTAAQIKWALQHGFAEVKLDVSGLLQTHNEKNLFKSIEQPAAEKTIEHLKAGTSVVVHTGSPDSDLAVTKSTRFSCLIGTSMGQIARAALKRVAFPRLCVAGGDTSGYVAQALGLEALEMIAPIVPGAPLCRARARGSPADGLEVNFKGGQIGGPNYFALLANGSLGRTPETTS